MSAERREQILAASSRRQSQASAPQSIPTMDLPPPVPAPKREAAVRNSGGKDFSITLVPPGTPREKLRNPQGVAGSPLANGNMVVGAQRQQPRGSQNVQAVVSGARRGNGVTQRQGSAGGGVQVIKQVRTQSSSGVEGAMTVEQGAPLLGRQPTPAQVRQQQAKAQQQQQQIQAQQSSAPPVDCSIVLAYHARPDVVEPQRRLLLAQSVRPFGVISWINPSDRAAFPAGVAALLDSEPAVRPNVDMGPWMRWSVAAQCTSEFVVVLDDDTMPGPKWIEHAISRLRNAGEHDIVAAAGHMYSGDRWDQIRVVGPKAPPSAEVEVDVGIGGWVMRVSTARLIAAAPRVGEVLSTGLHVASVVQANAGLIIVLSYERDHAGWGMLEDPRVSGSISEQIAEEAAQGLSPSVEEIRDAVYGATREQGWMPMCVVLADHAADADSHTETA